MEQGFDLNTSPKMKFIGGVDFEELKAQRVQLYHTITVDLNTARSNEERTFTGNYIYALEATDVDANLDIRFNETFRAAINIKEGRGIRVPFYRLYITNAAQAGKNITLAIGIEASDFEIFDIGKALGITGQVHVINDELVQVQGYPRILSSTWDTEGIKTTPTIGLLMADTGQLTAGKYDFQVWTYTNQGAISFEITIQHRNAVNGADINSFRSLGVTAQIAGYRGKNLEMFGYSMATDERFRVLSAVSMGGNAQVSILAVRRE